MLYFSEIICLSVDIRKIVNRHLNSKCKISYKQIVYENVDDDLLQHNIGVLISEKLSAILVSSFKNECNLLFDDEIIINIYWTTQYDNNYNDCIVTFNVTVY
jgi:hypothetical protein